VSSFEEVEVQKKLVKEAIEVVEDPRYMTEARRKEPELRQRQKEESTSVVKKEKRKFSLFPHHHHRSESHAACGRVGTASSGCIRSSSGRRLFSF
jgi:hypothetical protein